MEIVRAPAKLNLFLEVLGKRPDGFHEIQTVMTRIGIYDTLRFRLRRRGFRLICNDPRIPTDETNTIAKAFGAIQRRARWKGGLDVRLGKGIPSQAGLGGGSSDAAATLLALNKLLKLDLGLRELHDIGATIGSDVNFFLTPSPALCLGRGEIVQPLFWKPRGYAIVLCPPFGISTRELYSNLRMPSKKSRRHVKDFLATITSRFSPDTFFNRLEETAFRLHPRLASIKRRMASLGFSRVLMTGSGSALFGLCKSRKEVLRLAEHLMQKTDGQTFVARFQH